MRQNGRLLEFHLEAPAEIGSRCISSPTAGPQRPAPVGWPPATDVRADRGRATIDHRNPQVPGDAARSRHQKYAI